MDYVYVLTGWEGSAADSRILRDAVTRTSGLRVPHGSYYLCDGATKMAANSSVHVTDRGKKKSLPSSRRVWTYEEEKELVCALKELVVRGLKFDNSFKSGYLNLLENILASKLIQQHVDLKHKTFTFYSDWLEVFGNDRATRGDSHAYVDAKHEIENESNKPKGSSVGDDKNTEIHNNYEFTTTNPAFFTVGESSSATRDKGKGLKRKQIDNLDLQFIDTMINFSDKTDSRFGQLADTMGCIAKRVGSEYDACNRRG
ncbi:hypothetical protein ACS0TY_033541 [Phlomoides rotata]